MRGNANSCGHYSNCVSDVRDTVVPPPRIYSATIAQWGHFDLQVDANGSFVSNNKIFTILFFNSCYNNWINEISFAASNETFKQSLDCKPKKKLTHWGRVTHICVGKLTIIGSDNGLMPERRQAIIWTNAGILIIGPLGTNFSEILSEIHTFSLKKMLLKMSSAKWRPFCLGLNVLKDFKEKRLPAGVPFTNMD